MSTPAVTTDAVVSITTKAIDTIASIANTAIVSIANTPTTAVVPAPPPPPKPTCIHPPHHYHTSGIGKSKKMRKILTSALKRDFQDKKDNFTYLATRSVLENDKYLALKYISRLLKTRKEEQTYMPSRCSKHESEIKSVQSVHDDLEKDFAGNREDVLKFLTSSIHFLKELEIKNSREDLIEVLRKRSTNTQNIVLGRIKDPFIYNDIVKRL
jgi:hypothetical protein